MSSSLVPYTDMEKMAQTLVKRGLFGKDKTADDFLALMLIAQAEGLHPATVAVDYDLIQGRPAKKPNAMLRDFIKYGGRVQWHALDDTQADATFSHPTGGTVRIRWDMGKAQRAQLATKEMWKKYPSAMLRSRCISEAMRAVFPGATGGLYTPDEVREIAENEAAKTGDAIEARPDDIQGEVTSEADLIRRDMAAQSFRAALEADTEEADKAQAVYSVHVETVKDQELYRLVWSVLLAPERRAIKAYVDQAKAAEPKVLANGRSVN